MDTTPDPTPADHLRPLLPILGRWRSSGDVLDDSGAPSATIAGTDTYTLLAGGRWIAHDVDVEMGGVRALAHELIGGRHPEGGWLMHAYDGGPEGEESPSAMRLVRQDDGRLLLDGGQVRSWFDVAAGPDHMTTRWERRLDGTWRPWMQMRFDRT